MERRKVEVWGKRVSDAWERGEREWLLGEGKQSRDERRLRVSDATRGALWGRARGWLLEQRLVAPCRACLQRPLSACLCVLDVAWTCVLQTPQGLSRGDTTTHSAKASSKHRS